MSEELFCMECGASSNAPETLIMVQFSGGQCLCDECATFAKRAVDDGIRKRALQPIPTTPASGEKQP